MTCMLFAASCPRPCLIASVNRPPHGRDRFLSPQLHWRLGVRTVEMATFGERASPKMNAVRWSSVEVALNRMSKWLVAGGLAFAALWKHDVEIMWVFLGAIVDRQLSKILKKTLNHERPTPGLRSDPGMPSSHAQSIFYAATILVLSLFYRLRANYLAMIIVPAIMLVATYLSWLRVTQGLHTLSQVIVGSTVGSTFGALWFVLWHLLVQEVVPTSPSVQKAVVLGSAVFCVGYVIRHWLKHK